MGTDPLFGNLYRFSEFTGNMSLPRQQYLLAGYPAIMFATGTHAQAEWILPEIDRILGGRSLRYLFVSHFESDECGGLGLFRRRYPGMTVLCANFAAKELPAFGYKGKVVSCDEGSRFSDGDISLRFFRYPAEVHLRDGLLCFEENSGVFYGSDAIIRPSNGRESIVDGSWQIEVSAIGPSRILDSVRRERLKKELSGIAPAFAATGHGPCVRFGI